MLERVQNGQRRPSKPRFTHLRTGGSSRLATAPGLNPDERKPWGFDSLTLRLYNDDVRLSMEDTFTGLPK